VNSALSIQAALAGDGELQLRIGIHLGDVTVEDGRVYGDGVNVASRIYPLAEPGGVAVSGPVYDSIKNQPDITAAPQGDQTLKNVAAPVTVWSVTGAPGAPEAISQVPAPLRRALPALAVFVAALVAVSAVIWWNRPATVGPMPIRSLAVLPLADPSAGESGAYFSFGMTEALISELARIEDLRVISRTSVTPYEATTLSVRQIAAELGVDGIIEGSVLRSGDRVRITAQLIDARADTHLWAESYERDLGDVLALQAEVAREIARQVQVEVSPTPQIMTASTRPMSPEAYEAYLKGYYFQMKRTREDTLRAMRYFSEVIRLEPDHPLGYSGLADEYSCVPTHSWSIAESELWPSVPREMIARARENAQRALELDPMSGPARNSVALVRMFGDWDWPGAEAEFHKALELSPGRAWAHSTYAFFVAFLRRFDEAMVYLEQARALDPLRVETTMDMAALHAWTGNREEAYRWWKKAEEIDPTYPGLHQAVVIGFCGTKRHAEALATLEGANTKYPEDPLVLAEIAYCHAVAGDAARARSLLAEVEALAGAMYVSPVSRAMVHVGLGEHDRAFEALAQGIYERDFQLLYLSVEPQWDPLRDDPRFAELLGRIGLPRA
jgi:TolB-like protein/Tfp pilus assembly protein PilF